MISYINETAEAWLSELETTELPQGGDYLCHGGSFCCLGIAENLAKTPYKTDSHGVRQYANSEYTSDSELTTATRESLGMKSGDGYVAGGTSQFWVGDHVYNSIAGANDSGRHDFKAIAEAIRKQADKLFFPIGDTHGD